MVDGRVDIVEGLREKKRLTPQLVGRSLPTLYAMTSPYHVISPAREGQAEGSDVDQMSAGAGFTGSRSQGNHHLCVTIHDNFPPNKI